MTEKENEFVDYDAEKRKRVNFHPEVREGTSNGIGVQEGQQVVSERVETSREDPGSSS